MTKKIFIFLVLITALLSAQEVPSSSDLKHQLRPFLRNRALPESRAIEQFVADGKLRLSLHDAVQLMLLNNTEVRINQLAFQRSAFSLQRAFGPFDTILTSSLNPQRSTSPTSSSIQASSTLDQSFSLGASQLFVTGGTMSLAFGTDRNTNNSTFTTLNPALSSRLSFSVDQPLVKGRGLAVVRGPITIARRNLRQSQANFIAQINESIFNVINQYWSLVQAQKNLVVLQNSLKLADESYKRDKRALELGALSPLDIYRSESTVAQRRLLVLQAEYAIKPREDQLRRTIGADLAGADLAPVRPPDLELTEDLELPAMVSVDIPTASELALRHRPELEAAELQVANDDTSLLIANNNLKPDVSLSGFYTSSGLSGGIGDALGQVGGFKFSSYGAGLNLRIPVRNRAASSDLGNALISKKNDLYALRQKKQQINEEVRNAVHELELSKLSIAAAATSRELSKKTLASEQRKYELGAQTIFFVLDAQSQFEQAEQSYVQALISYRLAVSGVDRATGSLLENNKVSIEAAMK